MKNKYLYGAVLLGVLGLFAFTVSVNSGVFFSDTSLTAAVIQSKGVEYPVTAEYPSVSAKATSLISYGQISPSSPLKTFASTVTLPNVQTQNADLPPQTTSMLGYIVELTEQPLSVKYKELKSAKSLTLDTKTILASQKTKIINQQDIFLTSLSSSIKAKNSALISSKKIKRFNTVLNAIILNVDDTEAEYIRKLPNVKSVQPVQKVHAFLMDSVPLINAPQVWAGTVASTSITGRGIKIVIIDTGVDYIHPDLGGCLGIPVGTTTPCKVAGGYDFINSDTDPMDDMGHGTHVAAIAAGNGALKGVAPDATIYAYKVLDQNGYGTWETVIAGLEKTADPNGDGDLSDHLDIANLSLGGSGNPDDAVSTAVDNLVDVGVVVTIAAGNSGPGANTIGSPGTARKAITIGATDKYDNIAYFSSRGPVIWTASDSVKKYLLKPDIVAPGVNICAARYDSAFPQGNTNCNNDTNHVAISGTSMAAPHVAGEVALLLQLHHDWTPTEIKMVVRKGTVLAGPLQGYDESTRGSGRIDALKTLRLNKLPTAILGAMPVSNKPINITGTATAQNFSSYTLSYGFGQNPSPYTDIAFSGQSVMNGILHANFDTAQLNEGVNTIKLLVTDTSGNTSEDKAFLEVNNMEITSVGNTLNYVNGGIQQIKGFISLPSVTSYRVYYYSRASKVILCSGSSVPIGNVICSADFSSMQNGKHAIYLEVSQNGKLKTDTPFEMAVVKELMDNWPQEIYGFPRGNHGVIGNDNNQLDRQVLFPGYNNCGVGWCSGPPALSFYKSDGSFTKLASLRDNSNIPDDSFPSIYYDNVGKKNFLVLTDYQSTKIVGTDGVVFKTIPNQNNGETYAPTTIFDRNEDGVPEIYAISFNRNLEQIKAAGYDFQGKTLAGFPVSVPRGSGVHSSGSTHVSFLKDNETASTTVRQNMILIAGDYNVNNGFMTDLKLYAHVFSKNNQLIKSALLFNGVNKLVQVYSLFSAVADLNGDGNMEMVIMYSIVDMNLFLQNNYNLDAYTTYIQVLDNKGNIISSMSPIKGYMASQIAIGNLKLKKVPNIVAVLSDTWPTTDQGNKIIALDGSLRTLFEFNEQKYNAADNLIQGISIGDVDGDGVSEIALNYRPRWYNGSPSGVQIFDRDGLLERDIQIPTLGAADDFWGSPAILDDFDEDDIVDVTLQSLFLPKDVHSGFGNILTTRLYPLKLGGVLKPATIDWKTLFHDDAHTGCYGCFATSSVVIIEPDTQPTASIIGTPTLIMDYISPSEESALISTFRVAINAGSNDQKIAKNYAFWSYIRTDSGINMSGAMRYAQPSGTTDDGNGFYIIPANTTATFAVQTTFNPKIMFAGAYYGVLSQVRLGDYANQNYINFTPPNTTNTLVIIGEVSPYINSMSPNPVSPGSALTINGVRFGINVADTVYLYPNFKGGSVRQYSVRSLDDSTIRFTLSPKSIKGNYFLQIVHPQTGASNMVYLTLGDSPPEQPPAPASTTTPSESFGSGGGGGGGGGGTPAVPESPVLEHIPAPADLETSFLGQFVASVLNGFNLLFKLK